MIRSLREKTRVLLTSSAAVSSIWQCVEELVQNSLAAEADRIEVHIDCEAFFVRVSDNGLGIQRNELDAFFLENGGGDPDDKFVPSSSRCGRGWAAICNVSATVEVLTRHKHTPATLSKTFLNGCGGDVVVERQCRASHGTDVVVNGLFTRLPVRQRRMVPATEMRDVRLGLMTLSLAFPSVAFILFDRRDCSTPVRVCPASSFPVRFLQVFGHVSDQRLESVEYTYHGFRVVGCICMNLYPRRLRQFVFVNGREVRQTRLHDFVNKLLLHLLVPHFTLGVGSSVKYGAFVLLLSCEAKDYEVYFSPEKTWIEFCDWKKVETCFRNALYLVFSRHTHVSEAAKHTNSPSPILAQNLTKGDQSLHGTQPKSEEVVFRRNAYQRGLVSRFVYRNRAVPANASTCRTPLSLEESKNSAVFPTHTFSQFSSHSLTDGSSMKLKSYGCVEDQAAQVTPTDDHMWVSVYDEAQCEFVRIHSRSGLCQSNAPDCSHMPVVMMKTVGACLNEDVKLNKVSSLKYSCYLGVEKDCPSAHLAACRIGIGLVENQAQLPRVETSNRHDRSNNLLQGNTSLRTSHDHGDQAQSEVANQFASWKNPVFPAQRHGSGMVLLPAKQPLMASLYPMHCDRNQLHGAKIIGQVDRKFIACLVDLAVNNDRNTQQMHIVLVDQHAADERIRLEQLENALLIERPGHDCSISACIRSKSCLVVQSSPLSSPLALELGKEEVALCMSFQENLRHIGVHLHQNNHDNRQYVLIDHLPSILLWSDKFHHEDKACLTHVVACLIQEEITFWSANGGLLRQTPPVLQHEMASQACHGAIRFGDHLTREECSKLLSKLAACRLPFQCAHGRPSVVPLLRVSQLLKQSSFSQLQLWKFQT